MIIRCRPFYLAGEFTTILLVAVYIPPTHNSSDRDAALREDRQHIQMASPSSPEISIMLISRLSFQNFTSMLIVNLNPWTDYRVVKSSPFQWTPWDLWDRKLYMGFNGHKAIIFWSQSLYALDYTNVVCGFKIYFFMLRVWPFIAQLFKAVEKTQWERLTCHVCDIPSSPFPSASLFIVLIRSDQDAAVFSVVCPIRAGTAVLSFPVWC